MEAVTTPACNVFVKCPGCYQEVDARESQNDPELPFRCSRCRERTAEYHHRLTKAAALAKEKEDGQRITQDHVQDSAPAARRGASRDRKAKLQSTVAAVDDDRLDRGGDTGEAETLPRRPQEEASASDKS
jgi:endogenous inhibitor of DNA gyrase (YacG/DUF329 family)